MPAGSSVLDAWYGVVAYAFQIYFDFSGYSDMAIGLGLMMGFVFAKNFDSPYKSQSITEFWRRWHISLSTWLRDYLYMPLGGNRKGPARTYVNLVAVMLLGGLWHGASWNFVVWGGLHGALLAFERMRRQVGAVPRAAGAAARGADVRARADRLGVLPRCRPAVSDALPRRHGRPQRRRAGRAPASAASSISRTTSAPSPLPPWSSWACPQTWDWTRSLGAAKGVVIAGLFILAAIALTTQSYNPFIYFIF